MIGLEALFVQERGEPLAHTISERLAFLLGRDPAPERAALYRLGKRLYDARSNVVHSFTNVAAPYGHFRFLGVTARHRACRFRVMRSGP